VDAALVTYMYLNFILNSDPVMVTLTHVFSSNLKSAQNFDVPLLWHHNCEVAIFKDPKLSE